MTLGILNISLVNGNGRVLPGLYKSTNRILIKNYNISQLFIQKKI